MVRALNLTCIALMVLAVLGLYHVSEKTRVAHMELNATLRQIAAEKGAIAVMEAEWQHTAAPARVQLLAVAQGMKDAASTQVTAFDQLPSRGDEAPLNGARLRNANAVIAAPSQDGLQN